MVCESLTLLERMQCRACPSSRCVPVLHETCRIVHVACECRQADLNEWAQDKVKSFTIRSLDLAASISRWVASRDTRPSLLNDVKLAIVKAGLYDVWPIRL